MPYKRDDEHAAAELRRHIGAVVRAERETLGWSQERLAEAVGVGAEMLGRYERGAKFPSHLTLVRLAHVLGVTTDALLGVSPGRDAPNAEAAGPSGEIARRLPALSEPQLRAVQLVVRELVAVAPRRRAEG